MQSTFCTRRSWMAVLALGLAGVATLAHAQTYPVKPIELVVPYPPGASTDLIARILQPKLSAALGAPVVVDNRGGAGGNVGTAYVAKSPADGYRLVLTTNAIPTINPHVYQSTNFDSLKDLAPVGLVANGPIGIAVRTDLGINTLAELVAYAKKNPSKLSYGSAGNGSPQHVIGELLKQRAGISMVHVPYRGIGPALTDLLGGTINVMISTLAAVNPQVAAGKVKVLAIAEAKRYEGAPNIPTVAETYPGFEASAWFAIYAPAGTPPDIIHRLNGLINAALHAEDVKAKFLANSLVPSGGTPEMLGQLTRSDYERWGKLIKKNNIKAD